MKPMPTLRTSLSARPWLRGEMASCDCAGRTVRLPEHDDHCTARSLNGSSRGPEGANLLSGAGEELRTMLCVGAGHFGFARAAAPFDRHSFHSFIVAAGDCIEISIDGIGVLANTVEGAP